MVVPVRHRSSSIRAPLTILALALLVLGTWLGVWQLRQRGTSPPSAPVDTAAPSSPNPAPTPTRSPASREGTATDAYDLGPDEAKGGHTLARHVGRTDAQLRERLDRERNISAASTYTDRAIAERTVARTLTREAARVSAWRARTGSRPNLALDYRGAAGETLGRSIRRGRSASDPCMNAIVVLRWDGRNGFVLTSYPESTR